MLSIRRYCILFFVIAAPLALIAIDYVWNHQGELTSPEQVAQLQVLAIPMALCTLLLPLGPCVVAWRDNRKRGTLVIGLSALYIVLSFGAAAFVNPIASALYGSDAFTSEAADTILIWIEAITFVGVVVYVAAVVLACQSALRLHHSRRVQIAAACAVVSAALFVIGGAFWPLWTLAMLLHAFGWATILLTLYKNEPATIDA